MVGKIPSLCMLAAFALVACATPPVSNPAAVASAPKLRVVVTPLNLAVRTPSELEGKGDRVWFEVLRYLQDQDGYIATLSPNSAERMWLTVTENLDAPDRKQALRLACSRLAQTLAEYRSYDLLVIPSLVLRPGRLHGRYASWDGVHRVVPKSEDVIADGVGDVFAPLGSVMVAGLTGNVGAASLHVSVLRSDGTLAYEGLGGLDLVQRPHRNGTWDGQWTFEAHPDPLGEPLHIREGVERAFGHQLLASVGER